ncbi:MULTISPECIES: hypothetical protein [unclassified Enterobacter]|uniref:hypothetical protein n=1 Tax=unclassified Enterobacter TaxID=2608935 RepID=UPI002570E357|nr:MULTISPECIES: hypothetical protein [unclassified Enterobacter]
MDKFNRELQRELLKCLYDATPYRMPTERENHFCTAFGGQAELVANLLYLRDHGLINVVIKQVLSGSYIVEFESLKINSKGIDFVRDDGGLSAILNVTTIKFHREAVVVIEDLIALSNMSAEEKEKAKSKLGELSFEALKAVVQTATTVGLSALLK